MSHHNNPYYRPQPNPELMRKLVRANNCIVQVKQMFRNGNFYVPPAGFTTPMNNPDPQLTGSHPHPQQSGSHPQNNMSHPHANITGSNQIMH